VTNYAIYPSTIRVENPCERARHEARIGKIAGSLNADGYVKLIIDGRSYYAHKVAWLVMTGEWVTYPEFEIDHKNRCRSDNRWGNLRKVNKSGNQRNAGGRKDNTSGVHGVNWKPLYPKRPGYGRWVARIWDGPKHLYLGSFKEIEDAKRARREAEARLGYEYS